MEKTLEYYMSLDYPVEIRRIDDSLGGGYMASIPSLGSYAFLGDGATPQQAYDNLLATKKQVFEEYLEEGLAIPEPVDQSEYEDYSGKYPLRMPRELHATLAAAAKRNHTSLNQYLVYALSSFDAKRSLTQEASKALSTAVTRCVTSEPGDAHSELINRRQRSNSWTSTLPSCATTQRQAPN